MQTSQTAVSSYASGWSAIFCISSDMSSYVLHRTACQLRYAWTQPAAQPACRLSATACCSFQSTLYLNPVAAAQSIPRCVSVHY